MRGWVSIIFVFISSCLYGQKVVVKEPVRFLALGDSYTIGQSVIQQKSWPYLFKDYLISNHIKVDTMAVIARTGWTASNLKNGIDNANPSGKFNLVSLLIGVNNQYQGLKTEIYINEFEELLQTAISVAGNKEQVFVLSIPDYGYTPFGASNWADISREIDTYNAINKTISDRYNVSYFNITEISRLGLKQPFLVAADGLHPSGEMYQIWVDSIVQHLILENEVSTSNENLENRKERLKIRIDARDKTAHFELNENDFSNHLRLDIFQLNGTRITSKQFKSSVSIDFPSLGCYIYRISSKTKHLYKGKIIIN